MRRNLKGVKKIVWEGVVYSTVADMARSLGLRYNEAYGYVLRGFVGWDDVAKWKRVNAEWYRNLRTGFLCSKSSSLKSLHVHYAVPPEKEED